MNVVTSSYRHLVIGLLALSAACGGRRASTVPAPSTPDQAVEQFLGAVNENNLELMANFWGDENGPLRRYSESERRQRLQIMQRMLRSDNHMITATDASDPAKRILTVAMTQGSRRFAVPFTVVPVRSGGWLIREIGLDAAMPSAGSTQTTPVPTTPRP
jgi:hypothetical protein